MLVRPLVVAALALSVVGCVGGYTVEQTPRQLILEGILDGARVGEFDCLIGSPAVRMRPGFLSRRLLLLDPRRSRVLKSPSSDSWSGLNSKKRVRGYG